MKLSLYCKKSIKAFFLILSLIILTGCYSRGKHPCMPDIGQEMVPKAFSKTTNILVLPLWQIIPHYFDENMQPVYLVSFSFISQDLKSVSSNLPRPEGWGLAMPTFRIGSKMQLLKGIYLFLNTGEVVWLRASLGYTNRWSYIKWATMSKQWQNEVKTAIEKRKAWRSGESNTDFWGADYKFEMKIKVEMTPDEKKMVKEYLDSINYENITNSGQWKLVTE